MQVRELLDIDIREFIVGAGYCTEETINKLFLSVTDGTRIVEQRVGEGRVTSSG